MGEAITKIKEKWLVGIFKAKIMCKMHHNKEQQKNSGEVITKIKEGSKSQKEFNQSKKLFIGKIIT